MDPRSKGSRARHVQMKHIYGLQQQERQSIEQDLKPLQAPSQPLTIDNPSMLDLLNLERWKREQEAKINAEYNRRLSEVKEVAEKAQKAAVANATTKEQEKVLRQKLATAEGLKQANHKKVQKVAEQLIKTTQLVEKVAVLIDEKRLNSEWSQQTAQKVRERVLPQLERDIRQSVQSITTSDVNQAGQQLRQSLEQRGYELTQTPEGKTSLVIEPKSGVQLNLTTEHFGGKSLRELINQRVEEVRQEELKPKLRQSRGRGLGM